MKLSGNHITLQQWAKIVEAVKENSKVTGQSNDALYIGEEQRGESKRLYCYDNYDRFHSPGLDFVSHGDSDQGSLYVYNVSELALAPITLKEGMQIAENFFNEYGSQMAEEIVCEYVMKTGSGASLQ